MISTLPLLSVYQKYRDSVAGMVHQSAAPRRCTKSSRYKMPTHIMRRSLLKKKTSSLALSFRARHARPTTAPDLSARTKATRRTHCNRTGFQHPITMEADRDIELERQHCTLDCTHRNTRHVITFRGHNTSQAKPGRGNACCQHCAVT